MSKLYFEEAMKAFVEAVQKDQRSEFAFMAMDSDIVSNAFAEFVTTLLGNKEDV